MKKLALVFLASAVMLISSIDEANAARRRGCCREPNPCRQKRTRCCDTTTHEATPSDEAPTPAPAPEEEAAPAPAAA
ncbi:MAG: hypothetical protein O2955_21370 [Planctomycetota bacterium]|nr:hypothetical protein [Planctomycetota bacterium]MDA1215059.1 hypothetical protein [Planctomycetota bacterium]